MTLRKLGSHLQGHPDMKLTPGVEVSTGSLGQGLSMANGIALSTRLDKKNNRIYVLMGDGEQQEGQIWEAAMTSSHYKIDNLCGIVDRNGLQIDGPVKEIMDIDPLPNKWKAFGWQVFIIDGHNFSEILTALNQAENIKGMPSMIIANTVKGKGVSIFEHQVKYHGVAPTDEGLKIALRELGEGD
jgi:transketolase